MREQETTPADVFERARALTQLRGQTTYAPKESDEVGFVQVFEHNNVRLRSFTDKTSGHEHAHIVFDGDSVTMHQEPTTDGRKTLMDTQPEHTLKELRTALTDVMAEVF